MQNQFIVATDKEEKLNLESAILQASWIAPVAHGGFEAAFEVRTVFVAEGSTIEIKGKSSKGKAPGKVKGQIFNNRFKATLFIPEKVEPGADIWFEAKLPRHGLTMESDEIPARPPVSVSKLCWDKKKITRNEEVTLTCQFESGVAEGDEVFFIVYEHNPGCCDFKIATFSAYVEGNKAEITWGYNYDNDTAGIATEEEMQTVDKKYVSPQYYFIVAVNGIRAGTQGESGMLRFVDTVTLRYVDCNDIPVKNASYIATFADGSTREGMLDDEGTATLEDVPPGKVTVEYETEE